MYVACGAGYLVTAMKNVNRQRGSDRVAGDAVALRQSAAKTSSRGMRRRLAAAGVAYHHAHHCARWICSCCIAAATLARHVSRYLSHALCWLHIMATRACLAVGLGNIAPSPRLLSSTGRTRGGEKQRRRTVEDAHNGAPSYMVKLAYRGERQNQRAGIAAAQIARSRVVRTLSRRFCSRCVAEKTCACQQASWCWAICGICCRRHYRKK